MSPGCEHCYAETLADRYGFDAWGPKGTRRTFGEKHWREPLSWDRKAAKEGKPHRVFCSSMCDVFEDHPVVEGELKKLWPLIRATQQLLTKRAERIALCLPPDWGKSGYPNCWLGVSVENQEYVYRADLLRQIPARVRWISYEPALGPLRIDLGGIDWMVVGGESGPGFRPMDPEWAMSMFLACRRAGTKFFFKQMSGPRPGMPFHYEAGGIVSDLDEVKEFP